ncbi:MAG TPA: IclR family transcriptional regulator [Amycolatopsis sp.]|nr:IclR family transcriptional regulator [Amycolatopsis sp.]
MNKAVNDSSPARPEPRGAVDKALEVLAALARPGGPHRLAEVAKACDLPKPTAHRMLQTFADAGFAIGTGGAYDVGPRLLGLSAATLAGSRLTRAARPVLVDLRKRTGLTAQFAVRHADRAVYVDKVEPQQAYRLNTRPGGEVPLYCTGVGRAILSRLPASEVSAVLDSAPLKAWTAKTLTDPAAIRAELATVDRCGYVVDDEEHETHVRCVAAPVVGAAGAVSVAGLTFTLPPDALESLGPLVAEAASRISAKLTDLPSALSLVSDED